jgi:hypothetical protein
MGKRDQEDRIVRKLEPAIAEWDRNGEKSY